MPVGSYGFGNLFFGGRGRFRTRRGDASLLHFDGLECFNVILPVLPLTPVHVWDWRQISSDWSWTKRVTDYEYRAIPLRWTWDLPLRVLLRYWLWLPLVAGLLLSMSAAHTWPAKAAGSLVFAFSAAGLALIFLFDRRDQKIRRLLGLHRLGYSDPVYWTDELRALVADPPTWFKQPTFGAGAEQLIAAGRWSDALWAARLCAAVENAADGEALTDRILSAAGDVAPDLGSPEYPKLQSANTECGEYWRGMAFGRSKARFTEALFAGHIGGAVAQALEDDDEEDELAEATAEALREPNRAVIEETPFRAAGVGMIAATILCCAGLIWFAGWFPKKSAAQLAVEQHQREQAERRRLEDEQREKDKQKELTPQPLGDPGSWRQVAELPLLETKPGPWPVATDGTTGKRVPRLEIAVGGVPSPKGIGMHPPEKGFAAAKIRLNREASRFTAAAALNDTAVDTKDVAIFEVWGDGKQLWQSKPLRKAADSDPCDLDLRGIDVLEMRVVCPGDYWGLHAVWVDPKVLVAE